MALLKAKITLTAGVSLLSVTHDDSPSKEDLESLIESLDGVAGGILVINPRYEGHPVTLTTIIAECLSKFNCLVVRDTVVYSRLSNYPVGSLYEINTLSDVDSVPINQYRPPFSSR